MNKNKPILHLNSDGFLLVVLTICAFPWIDFLCDFSPDRSQFYNDCLLFVGCAAKFLVIPAALVLLVWMGRSFRLDEDGVEMFYGPLTVARHPWSELRWSTSIKSDYRQNTEALHIHVWHKSKQKSSHHPLFTLHFSDAGTVEMCYVLRACFGREPDKGKCYESHEMDLELLCAKDTTPEQYHKYDLHCRVSYAVMCLCFLILMGFCPVYLTHAPEGMGLLAFFGWMAFVLLLSGGGTLLAMLSYYHNHTLRCCAFANAVQQLQGNDNSTET